MQLLDGKTLSEQILDELKQKVSTLSAPPCLAVILVGNDPASLKYVQLKKTKADFIGIKVILHHLPSTTSQAELVRLVTKLNQDPSVNGYFIQLPLPSSFDRQSIFSLIDPAKDVDGLNPDSGFTPAVVIGIIKLLQSYNIDLDSQKVVIINDSPLIGQPLKKILSQFGAFITLCNDRTQDLPAVTSRADILISAAGVKNLITADMVKPEAVVVDVAGGDVDFASVAPQTSFITPTFGGVGPMTIAMLLTNSYTLYKNKNL